MKAIKKINWTYLSLNLDCRVTSLQFKIFIYLIYYVSIVNQPIYCVNILNSLLKKNIFSDKNETLIIIKVLNINNLFQTHMEQPTEPSQPTPHPSREYYKFCRKI